MHLDRLGPGDLGRLRAWLQRPDVQAWWGSGGRAEAEVALALNSPSAICRLIVAGSEPVGYAQALDAVLLEEAVEAGLAAGTWQCALFIGSQAHSGRGLGGLALQALLAEVFGSTLAVACAIRVPVRNERAVRTIEGQGFRWLRVESDAPLGPLWLMLLERPRA